MSLITMDEIDCEYCARCGARTIKPSSKYRHCDACQTDYYINPRPCNAIIITDASGRALLTLSLIHISEPTRPY